MGLFGGLGGALLGGIGGALSSGDKTTTQTRRVDIPSFLRPLVDAQIGTNLDALNSLGGLLGNGANLVSPFDPLQTQAQQLGIDVAGGAGGFLPTAQQGLLSTARGDFLAGGPGFNEAVDASIRAARPHILSAFGRAGGRPGGLANVAIQQAASDAFANLFGQERARQMAAQQALPNIGLAGANILDRIGGVRQQQAQREALGPVEAINLLLDATRAGGINLNSLLGATGTNTTPGIGPLAGGLLGALGGAQVGSGLGGLFGGGGGGLTGTTTGMGSANWGPT